METDRRDTLCSDLIASATVLKNLCKNETTKAGRVDLPVSVESNEKIRAAEQKLGATCTAALLAQPRSFMFQLATNVQLLACLKWLGEFQVLACVPLSGCISFKELSALADAPEHMLVRVARMAATTGFLHEPVPYCVAHTFLSAAYTDDLSLSDACMLLATQIIPSTLQVKSHSGASIVQPPSWSLNGCRPKAGQTPMSRETRQWTAFCRTVGPPSPVNSMDKASANVDIIPLLDQLDWPPASKTSIVYVCAKYEDAAASLRKLSPDTQVIVQTYGASDLDSSIMARSLGVQMRQPGTPQQVSNATVYILQPEISRNVLESPEILACELKAHLDCLRANRTALLIVAPRLLPQPGSVAGHVEIGARLTDFVSLQLNNQCALELEELELLIEATGDARGKLAVKSHLRDETGATAALALKFEPI